jgi:uncharacterized protein YbaR (Trm112 family)
VRASLEQQLETQALVCPQTREPLERDGAVLRCSAHTYPIIEGVPILLANAPAMTRYASESDTMTQAYTRTTLADRIKQRIKLNDYRTQRSRDAVAKVLDVPIGSLCLSIGGGPLRASANLVNVNIGRFANVDIVGDAHCLPYADSSVDAVHSEAVFEHLSSPTAAANEMFRVMKPGAKAWVCSPFLHAYHGYPHHYQNFTLTGHAKLFADAGFEVTESGVCVGPTFTLLHLVRVFGVTFLPQPLKLLTTAAYVLGRLVIGPLDKILGRREDAHVMAATTYLVARKPY